jgi:hypothetical protein
MRATSLVETDESLTHEQRSYLRALLREPLWFQRKSISASGSGTPRHLYKYAQLDPKNEPSIKRARDILVGSTIWLSKPTSFNDPFDFRVNAELSSDPVRRRKYFERIANANVPRGRRYKARLADAIRRTQDRHIQDPGWVKRTFDNMADTYGVCCFCEDPRSILMWSHYADSHRGICFQFEVARDSRLFAKTLAVRYTPEFSSVQWPEDKAHVVDRVLLPKFNAWIYEAERRLIEQVGDRSTPFAAAALSGVVVGNRVTVESKGLLGNLLAERTAAGLPMPKLLSAHLDPKAYKLRLMRVAKSFLNDDGGGSGHRN